MASIVFSEREELDCEEESQESGFDTDYYVKCDGKMVSDRLDSKTYIKSLKIVGKTAIWKQMDAAHNYEPNPGITNPNIDYNNKWSLYIYHKGEEEDYTLELDKLDSDYSEYDLKNVEKEAGMVYWDRPWEGYGEDKYKYKRKAYELKNRKKHTIYEGVCPSKSYCVPFADDFKIHSIDKVSWKYCGNRYGELKCAYKVKDLDKGSVVTVTEWETENKIMDLECKGDVVTWKQEVSHVFQDEDEYAYFYSDLNGTETYQITEDFYLYKLYYDFEYGEYVGLKHKWPVVEDFKFNPNCTATWKLCSSQGNCEKKEKTLGSKKANYECSGGHVYYFNSCGVRTEVKEFCISNQKEKTFCNKNNVFQSIESKSSSCKNKKCVDDSVNPEKLLKTCANGTVCNVVDGETTCTQCSPGETSKTECLHFECSDGNNAIKKRTCKEDGSWPEWPPKCECKK